VAAIRARTGHLLTQLSQGVKALLRHIDVLYGKQFAAEYVCDTGLCCGLQCERDCDCNCDRNRRITPAIRHGTTQNIA
jgi:hypothetical protein